MPTYIDKKGYKRHSNLVHREKAYWQIYKKNRDKYPLRFSEYVVHHKDGDKRNNHLFNLELLTPEEHTHIHGFNKDNKEQTHLSSMSSWELKKERSNLGDFSILRLLVGDKATEILASTIKLGLIFGLIVFIIGAITDSNVIITVGKYLLYAAALAFGITALLFFVGLIYNWTGNSVDKLKKVFSN